MSALEKQLQLGRLPPRPAGPAGGSGQAPPKMRMGPGRKRDFSPVSWSQYFESMEDVVVETDSGKDTFRVYKSGSEGPVLLLLHGGGHSALSWAVFTATIVNRIQCRIVALDLRGHGETKVRNPEDLSAETMSKDVGNVVEVMYGDLCPPIMLIGHSMGGAIAVHTAASNLVPSLLGLCMIDVVEELPSESPEDVQIPGKCHRMETKKEAAYTWRIELAKTERYWEGWFRGLSNLFLNCPVPKLLLLAGVDRLDKDLTIGQMQVHEDAPEKVAEAVATFLVRHRFTEPIGGFQCVFPAC
ncbi:putative Protein phosphatase methylesterase 1 protein [Naja naja]|nr:putative Protein phosphatase methylesterase 1 protein [Naja naja]